MIAKDIAAVVGTLTEEEDRELLRLGDRAAQAHLAAGHSVFIDHNNDHHFDVFESIAEETDGESIREAKQVLKAFDALTPGQRQAVLGVTLGVTKPVCMEDVALLRWQQAMEAAYYFGLALGLRIASRAATAEQK